MSDPDAAPLYGLLYVSEAHDLTEVEIGELMRQARARNAEYGITGVLVALYPAGRSGANVRCERFVQWLEGPEVAVIEVFNAIARDPRHEDVFVVWAGPRERRLCPDWRMALRWREETGFLAALTAIGIELDTEVPAPVSAQQVRALVLQATLGGRGAEA